MINNENLLFLRFSQKSRQSLTRILGLKIPPSKLNNRIFVNRILQGSKVIDNESDLHAFLIERCPSYLMEKSIYYRRDTSTKAIHVLLGEEGENKHYPIITLYPRLIYEHFIFEKGTFIDKPCGVFRRPY